MLVKYISQIGIDPHTQDGQRLIEECILCLAGVNTAFDFQRNVKSIDLKPTGMSGKDLRLKLLEKSYLTLNVKYAALFLSFMPNNSDTYAKLQSYLNAADIIAMREVFARRTVKNRVKQYAIDRGLTVYDVTFKAMKVDKHKFESYVAKVVKHIKMKVYTKLRFVVKGENGTLTDFNGDLTCKALRAYHSLIPTKKPEAYILNYLRSAATNETNNLCDKHTATKRRRMVNSGADGFGGNKYEIICQSENQTQHATDDTGVSEFDRLMGDGAVHTEHGSIESTIMYERILNKFTGRKRTALEIMAGSNDDKFTDYLVKKGSIKSGDDHADFQRRVSHHTFLNALASYLGVIREAFMRFVQNVGSTLIAHKEYA